MTNITNNTKVHPTPERHGHLALNGEVQARLQIGHAFHLDRGPRENLEDAIRVLKVLAPQCNPVDYTAMLVLDGVGSRPGGSQASNNGGDHIGAALMTRLPIHNCELDDVPLDQRVRAAILSALVAGNERLLQLGQEKPELAGLASTAVCAVICDNILTVGWVGDSRAYLFHDGEILRITRDHKPKVDPLSAAFGYVSHTINRFLGQHENFRPDMQTYAITAGDIILLCTDGLTDVLDDETIKACIKECAQGELAFDDLPHRLVQEALRQCTTDNVSALCAQCLPTVMPVATTVSRTCVEGYHAALAGRLEHLCMETAL